MDTPLPSDLTHALSTSWDADTSVHDDWDPSNSAWGQADVTCAVIHYFYGGKLKMALSRPKLKHFWNITHFNPRMDLTIQQFETPPKWEISRIVPIKAVLCDIDTKKRYIKLMKKVGDFLDIELDGNAFLA